MNPHRVVPVLVLVAATAVVFLWPTTHPDQPTASEPPTTTTVPDIPGVYGGSWEVVAGAPVADRIRMAITAVGDSVFVWGGTLAGFVDADLPEGAFFIDGYFYHPAQDRWEALPPSNLCSLIDPAATVAETAKLVVVWGFRDGSSDIECDRAATYHLITREWVRLDGDFFGRIVPSTTVVWQNPSGAAVAGRLVAPEVGLFYDLDTGETGALEGGPAPGGSLSGPVTWTGEWLLAVDGGRLLGWEGATETWWTLGGTPIGAVGQDVGASDAGVFLVNEGMQAAVLLGDPQSNLWSVIRSLPLRGSACPPAISRVGGLPVVHTCVGVAVYDPAIGGWVPFSPPIGLEGEIVGTSDSVYWFSGQVSRLRLPRAGVVPPRRLPIGLTTVVLPDGFYFDNPLGLVQTQDANLEVLAEVHGFEVSTPSGGSCRLLGSYQPGLELPQPFGVISVARPDLSVLEVLDYSTGVGVRFVLETGPTDVIEVRCGARQEAVALLAALLWIDRG